MPDIRSMRDLHDTSAIQWLDRSVSPKNGRQDLVTMSTEEFERRCTREEVYGKLHEAEGDMSRGDLLEADDVFRARRAKHEY